MNPTSTKPVILGTSRISFCNHKAQTELRKQKRRLQALFCRAFCSLGLPGSSMFLLIQLVVKFSRPPRFSDPAKKAEERLKAQEEFQKETQAHMEQIPCLEEGNLI